MHNILVFPAGSEIGLEIQRAFVGIKEVCLYGGTSVKDHSHFSFTNNLVTVPFYNNIEFFNKLYEIIKQYKIDFIFPAHDDVAKLLSHAQEHNLLPDGVNVLGSCYKTNEIIRSKAKTYHFLKDIIAVPETYNLDTITENVFPVFVKPDIGQGSKGAEKVDTLSKLKALISTSSHNLLICEFLSGEEYTIDCFTDRHGTLRYSSARIRSRTTSGISSHSVEIHDPKITEIAFKINGSVALRGMWFFQLKKNHQGDYILLEIAARVGGGMGFARIKGVNLPLLALYDRLGYDVDIFENNVSISRDSALRPRYSFSYDFDTIYIDLDDNLIAYKCVNPKLISLIYHWKNQKKCLILLTRHRETYNCDPLQTLRKHCIDPNLFQEIIEVEGSCKKSEKIIKEKAIFIDDSYKERIDVHMNNKIPTFTYQQAFEALLPDEENFYA